MTKVLEKKILEKLDRIERKIDGVRKTVNKRPRKNKELTEEDVLKIVEEGDREYRGGSTEDLEDFIKREYPQYAKLLHQKDRDHPRLQKSVSKAA